MARSPANVQSDDPYTLKSDRWLESRSRPQIDRYFSPSNLLASTRVFQLVGMAKEFFSHEDSRQLFKTIEDISRRSGVSRAQAFEDVLRACVAALAAETMELDYLEAIKAHTDGSKGKRGVDLFPVFLGQLVEATSNADNDLLGDLFQGAISYGENGLYLTPAPVAQLIAQMTVEPTERAEDGRIPLIHDPCCGTGVLLMEAGKINPHVELVGQDVDARCARITSINLGLRGKYGWVICGNSLTRDVQFVHRIGGFFHEGPNGLRRGVIRQVPPEECPVLPELHRTTTDVQRTLAPASDEDVVADVKLPGIIEIPRWLQRLEHLTADRCATVASEKQSDVGQAPTAEGATPGNEPTPGPQKQGTLFD